MIAVAQDAQGAARVTAAVRGMELGFPVLVDEKGEVARELGFRIVPAGAMVNPEGTVVYRSDDDFDIADPRLRSTLESFLSGRPLAEAHSEYAMKPAAMTLFAEGVQAGAGGDMERALALWRDALSHDPDNFLIRSQIWAAEHPERFWPVVDRDWQERQLMKEGYDGPLP